MRGFAPRSDRAKRLVEHPAVIDRNLAGETARPGAYFAECNDENIRRHAERLAVHSIREFLRWLVTGDQSGIPNSQQPDSNRYSVERIGCRALSAAWVIDTGILEGKSLRQISDIPAAQSDMQELSGNVAVFKAKFRELARRIEGGTNSARQLKQS